MMIKAQGQLLNRDIQMNVMRRNRATLMLCSLYPKKSIKKHAMKRLIVAVLVCLSAFAQAQVGKGDIVKTTVQLLNGKNLDGWYSFLATKGKNNDPDKVFTVEDGLLHVSGKEFGYICTNKVYKNFVLTVEFKWGEKKYPPRDADTTRRDNGILFFLFSNT